MLGEESRAGSVELGASIYKMHGIDRFLKTLQGVGERFRIWRTKNTTSIASRRQDILWCDSPVCTATDGYMHMQLHISA